MKNLTVESINKNSNKYHITHTQETPDGWKVDAKGLAPVVLPRHSHGYVT